MKEVINLFVIIVVKLDTFRKIVNLRKKKCFKCNTLGHISYYCRKNSQKLSYKKYMDKGSLEMIAIEKIQHLMT
jgi:hypothetical protein